MVTLVPLMTLAIELPRLINVVHGGVWARAAAERDLDETYMTAANVLAEVKLIERVRTEEADPYKALRLELQLYRDVLEAISTVGQGYARDDAKCAEAALFANKADLNRRCGIKRAHPRRNEVKATGMKMLDANGQAWTLLPWEHLHDIVDNEMYWRRCWRNNYRLRVAALVVPGGHGWTVFDLNTKACIKAGVMTNVGDGKRTADKEMIALLT